MLGMHGTKAANLGVSGCDLLITVGARFSDRVTGNPKQFAKRAKIIQIDVDPAEINKNIIVDCSIIGDAAKVLAALTPLIEQQEHDEWLAHVEELKKTYPLKYDSSRLSGPFLMEEIYRVTGGDALIVTEVGQHQMWAAQYFAYREPHQLLTSGGLGTMGYGLGAAIGAKTGRPDKTVINVAGGLDFVTGLTASVACLGNVGPGFGEVGSMANYAHIPAALKGAGIVEMLLGRLEIFPVLYLFGERYVKN
jgi:acetolactate synthase-1/2/3 large subunit